ncbi:MAG: glycosyltransferase [Bacteroidales bacterium]
MQTGKTILICPLEWGLGHAGRMVPLASALLSAGNRVIIGSGEEHIRFFMSELEGLQYIHFPGFRIRYSKWLPQYLKVILKMPSFIFHTVREHYQLKRIIKKHRIDIVISDSRIGLWNKDIKTVLVTHMLRVPYPSSIFPEKTGDRIVRKVISKFSFCYVPDLPGEVNLSGKMSHGMAILPNVRFIGLLSRFSSLKPEEHALLPNRYDCTVILSGPEPQRSIMKEKVLAIIKVMGISAAILEGRPSDPGKTEDTGNIKFISHLPTRDMYMLLDQSDLIISRSGYSTIMELASIGKSAILIPTPGQPEQEYLAGLMYDRGWFERILQKDLGRDRFTLGPDFKVPGGMAEMSRNLLSEALLELMEEHHN